MNKKEIEYTRLVIGLGRAKNNAEMKLAEMKLAEFKKNNLKLVDEVQRRRWTAYGS